MEDKIIEILIDVCEDDRIKNDNQIDLLENEILDSLAFINLITRLEEEFDIEIQPTQIPSQTWKKLENIVNLVKSLIK